MRSLASFIMAGRGQAILVAAVFEFAGAYLAGGQVTSTIRKGIVDQEYVIGQPELRATIRQLPQVDQRVSLRYHLNALSHDETRRYLEHRLQVVLVLTERQSSFDLFDHAHQFGVVVVAGFSGVLYPVEEQGAEGEDKLLLGSQGEALSLPGGAKYENIMDAARQLVDEDPKRVAQLVKTWVNEEAA